MPDQPSPRRDFWLHLRKRLIGRPPIVFWMAAGALIGMLGLSAVYCELSIGGNLCWFAGLACGIPGGALVGHCVGLRLRFRK
jgi:hypothetical protein